jgi:membrane protease subunit HflC
MKRIGILIGLIVALLVLSVFGGMFYVVDETQQVIITQFGDPVGDPVVTPGLKVKTPFIQKAIFFEKRFIEWDGERNQIPTRDKRFIYVDTYARWQITDPLKYFQRLRDERGAQSRLDDILDGETRNAIANHDLLEVVRTTTREFEVSEDDQDSGDTEFAAIKIGRAEIAMEVLEKSQTRVTDLGIKILDFRFKRINYVEEVRREVYQRMISERKRIAEQFRSEGEGEAANIGGEQEKLLQEITSVAYRTAEETKGKADAKAADIYARAYNRDPDFYRFTKSMSTLEATLDADTILLLGTDGELLKYVENSK